MLRIALLAAGLLLSGQLLAEEKAGFRLGAQTHFEQGWPLDLMDRAVDLGVPALRDEIGWSDIETTKGVYDFTRPDDYMTLMIERGITPLLVFTDTNPLYDNGKTPYSKEGIDGFAAYVSEVLAQYGADKVQIEIGNEVNSDDFVGGPFLRDKPRYFAATIRRIGERVRRDHPEAYIICGGLNSIAIGFFRDVFRHGGLLACDAISVHPYRENPDTLMVELDRLKELMQEFGGKKPIHATEFGKWFEDPEDAPDYMLKMVMLMAAAGIRDAYWYALIDEEWWPNMGLLEEDGRTQKPAAAAFRFLQTGLLPLGRPTRRSTSAHARLFELGDGKAFVAWGSEGELVVSGEADYFDARGRVIPKTSNVGDTPVILMGDKLSVTLKHAHRIGDTKYQFNKRPWSYFARRPGIGLTPLEIIDGDWASFRGAPDLSPLRITDTWITTARFEGQPFHALERFTAVEVGHHEIKGWWRVFKDTEPSKLMIRHNDDTLLEIPEISTETFSLSGLKVWLEAGDTLDFELAPTGPDGTAATTRRIQIVGPEIGN